jgi:hypothetical protein
MKLHLGICILPPIYGTLGSTQIFKLHLQQTCESTTILWNLIFGVEMNDQLSKEILGQITWCIYGLKCFEVEFAHKFQPHKQTFI